MIELDLKLVCYIHIKIYILHLLTFVTSTCYLESYILMYANNNTITLRIGVIKWLNNITNAKCWVFDSDEYKYGCVRVVRRQCVIRCVLRSICMGIL